MPSFKECLLNVRQPAGFWTQLKELQGTFFDQLLPLPLLQPPRLSNPTPLHLVLGLATAPGWVICSRVLLPPSPQSLGASLLGQFSNACHNVTAQYTKEGVNGQSVPTFSSGELKHETRMVEGNSRPETLVRVFPERRGSALGPPAERGDTPPTQRDTNPTRLSPPRPSPPAWPGQTPERKAQDQGVVGGHVRAGEGQQGASHLGTRRNRPAGSRSEAGGAAAQPELQIPGAVERKRRKGRPGAGRGGRGCRGRRATFWLLALRAEDHVRGQQLQPDPEPGHPRHSPGGPQRRRAAPPRGLQHHPRRHALQHHPGR